ncbi:MAG: hypothetical protein ACRDIE_09945, partial [Chloroflexota bacterium]
MKATSSSLSRIVIACSLILAALWWTVGPVSPVRAATPIPVSICDQSHLQSAITQANSDNAGDTITFGCSGDIALTGNLFITGSMTLDGGNQAVTLDGKETTQVAFVNGAINVTFKNLTIANGNKQQSQGTGGGGIANIDGTVSVINGTLSNNVGGGGLGGAIYS